MTTNKHPTRHPTHILAEQGESLVKELIPPEWIAEKPEKDYGIDLRCELIECGEPAGLYISFQVKASPKLKRSATVLTKRLLYFAEKCRDPVFLVLVGVEAKAASFIFLQQWLDSDDAWRNKNGPSIPAKVVFTRQSILNASNDALIYMERRSRLSPQAVVAVNEDEINKLDPDLSVRMQVSRKSTRYEFFSNTEKTYKMSIIGEPELVKSANLALLDAISFGIKADISGVRVGISGSPLFDAIMPKTGCGSMQFIPDQHPATGVLKNCASGVEIFLQGELSKGRSGAAIRLSTADGFLMLTGKIWAAENRIEFVWHLSTKVWLDQDIRKNRTHVLALSQLLFSGANAISQPFELNLISDARQIKLNFKGLPIERQDVRMIQWMTVLANLSKFTERPIRIYARKIPKIEINSIDIVESLMKGEQVQMVPTEFSAKIPKDTEVVKIQGYPIPCVIPCHFSVIWDGAKIADIPVLVTLANYLGKISSTESTEQWWDYKLIPMAQSTMFLDLRNDLP